MKLVQLIFLILSMLFTFVSAQARYDMNTPVEGASIANDTLQFNVINQLYKKLSVLNSTCYDYSIKNTQLLHYPYDVKKKNNKYVSGYWKELWTVNMCGTYVQIPITFYIGEKETVFNIDDKYIAD